MNKIATRAIKITLTAGALAAALAGCCWCKSDRCCGTCCDKGACCEKSCNGQKSHGMNASLSLGAGTDGVHAGAGSSMK